MISYKRFPCSDALKGFVRSFWELEYNGEGPYIHRQLPDGCCELLFNFRGTFHEIADDGKLSQIFSAGLQAPSDQMKRFVVSNTYGLFGVYLYPYTVSMLFGVPAMELKNTRVDLISLMGSEGRDLETKIATAATTESRIATLSDFILHQIQKSKCKLHNIDAAIQKINHSYGNFNVGRLADELNTSVRQFERRFKELSGFRPKEYGKIFRFRSAIEALSKTTSLAAVALDFGYYDQSHFSNDFKLLSGFTPAEYAHQTGNEKAIYTA